MTASGLALYVPRNANTCWTAPLPCTPHPSANLRLIDANRLGSGFISSGPWNPTRYPNPDTRFLDSWKDTMHGRDGTNTYVLLCQIHGFAPESDRN